MMQARWGSHGDYGVIGLLFASLAACSGLSAPEASPTPSIVPTPPVPAQVSASDRWIEVDLAKQELSLHGDGAVVGRLPVSSGLMTYPEYQTPKGVFRVQSMEEGPIENVPGVFVSDIIIFDLGADIGIHSRPMAEDGSLLDDRLGIPVTGGCIRVGDSARVFRFARLGMWIWIH